MRNKNNGHKKDNFYN